MPCMATATMRGSTASWPALVIKMPVHASLLSSSEPSLGAMASAATLSKAKDDAHVRAHAKKHWQVGLTRPLVGAAADAANVLVAVGAVPGPREVAVARVSGADPSVDRMPARWSASRWLRHHRGWA